jgi:hypothetical protein
LDPLVPVIVAAACAGNSEASARVLVDGARPNTTKVAYGIYFNKARRYKLLQCPHLKDEDGERVISTNFILHFIGKGLVAEGLSDFGEGDEFTLTTRAK